MKLADVWFSAIAEAENSDRMIVVSGRTEIELVKVCPMRLPGN